MGGDTPVGAAAGGAGGGAGGAGDGYDAELYNRQLYVMGRDAQARMAASAVFISGLRGVGVEIAKNLALMGVKSITIHDNDPTEWADLSAQFYLNEADIGKPRAAACAARLAELNQYVPITVHTESAAKAVASGDFAVAIFTDTPLDEQLELNKACRANGTAFLSTTNRGAFGNIFADFGDAFVVTDQTGEAPQVCMVEAISKDDGTVTVRDEARHGFDEGTLVTFTEIVGMEELNDTAEPVKVVKSTGPYNFQIEGVEKTFNDYVSGGWVKEVKQPRTMKFKSLRDSLREPVFAFSDFGKMDNSTYLHAAFMAVDRFAVNKKRMPRAGNSTDAEELVGLAKAMAAELGLEIGDAEKFANLARAVSRCAVGQLGPVAAAIGGIAAQEALKACSGKFTPLEQWMYLDFAEILPDDADEADFAPAGNRYDGQVAVIGRKLQEATLSQRYFLVGAGAIGCEMLKNWAMMGLACGEGGRVVCTDMDNIEKSNLSRQFLFRPDDIGKAKSACAVAATKHMNPGFRGEAMELRVGADTEDTFNELFWDELTGVCTALDNVEARLYVDAHCVQSKKPLLESGTLGTKGNTQVVVPHKTENYGASQDPPEKGIPICTLKNFPNKIEHTLQWARDWFEGVFHNAPGSAADFLNKEGYLEALEKQLNTRVITLESIHDLLCASRPKDLADCVKWARLSFEKLFNHDIKQMLTTFPVDHVTSEGTPFWSGPKRAPTPATFNPEDPLHMTFIVSVANMRANVFGLPTSDDVGWVKSVLAGVAVPEFVAKGTKIATTEEEAKKLAEEAAGDEADARAERYIKDLEAARSDAPATLATIDFDKDIDTHMTVVTAVSNLRARNYRIEEADKHESRRIAGKIIPAIATTTAMVAGLVCIEFYKLLQDRPLEAFRNCYANLALPQFVFSEPMPCPTNELKLPDGPDGEARSWNWSLWDTIDIEGPKTLQEVIDHFETAYGLEANMVTYGPKMMYSAFMNPAKQAKRLAMSLPEVVQEVTHEPIAPGVTFVEVLVLCIDSDGEEADIPAVRYRLSAEERAAAGGAGGAAMD